MNLDPASHTSLNLRRAREGDSGSLGWIVERFSPLLLASARYRLPRQLRHVHDPEDLVQDVWCVVLPKLAELDPDSTRYTPVFVKYISQVLQYRLNNLMRKHIRGKPAVERGRKNRDGETSSPLDHVPAEVAGAVTRLLQAEQRELVLSVLEELGERDREIIVLRGIEQHPYAEIATVTGDEPGTLAVRYQRALARVRKKLPGSVFDELGSD